MGVLSVIDKSIDLGVALEDHDLSMMGRLHPFKNLGTPCSSILENVADKFPGQSFCISRRHARPGLT